MTTLIEIKGLHARYDDLQVLRGVDIAISEGEVVAILGSNGAGKTTLLRAISGVVATSGSILFEDVAIETCLRMFAWIAGSCTFLREEVSFLFFRSKKILNLEHFRRVLAPGAALHRNAYSNCSPR